MLILNTALTEDATSSSDSLKLLGDSICGQNHCLVGVSARATRVPDRRMPINGTIHWSQRFVDDRYAMSVVNTNRISALLRRGCL